MSSRALIRLMVGADALAWFACGVGWALLFAAPGSIGLYIAASVGIAWNVVGRRAGHTIKRRVDRLAEERGW